MKKLLSIILVFALLAVPLAANTAAIASEFASYAPEHSRMDSNASHANEANATTTSDDDNRTWWQIVLDFLLAIISAIGGVISNIADIVAGFTPLINLLNTIASLLRTLSIVIAVVAGSAAVIAIVGLIALFVL